MSTLTAADSEARRKELEQSAALALGKMLFAFSRLDMNLGLMLSSILRGTGRESEVKTLDSKNFKSRLELLAGHIEGSASLTREAKDELNAWLTRADEARTKRNQLVHGRWASDAHGNKVLNTAGLPSSDTQQTIPYSLAELEAYNDGVDELRSTLAQLRERWHLA